MARDAIDFTSARLRILADAQQAGFRFLDISGQRA